MPRISRDSIVSPFFHVMTQGIDKTYIFNQPEEIKYYIKTMYELRKEHNVKIIAYCIMSNHAHILIQTKNSNELSKFMQRLNIKYGKYYNKKHNRVGYVFRDRYKTEGIYTEQHLLNCIKYIYDNPVKAGICAKPEQYPYSNYKKLPVEINDDTFTFIDIEDDKEFTYMEEITQFINTRNINLEELKKDKARLENLIKILNIKHGLSLRKIAGILNIGRETVRKICTK